jgi:hypothetical protein
MRGAAPVDNHTDEIDSRFPGLAKTGETIQVPTSDGSTTPATIIRRELTSKGSVVFTLRFANGRMRTWEWFD